jgi:hypothetical protein
LKVTGFNDAIATAIGDAEGCHLPWWVNFELEMCLQIKSERNNVLLHRKKKVEFSFVHFSTGFQYKSYTASNLFLS